MKDLIIEYRDGKLAELRVDGVLLEGVTSLGFSHRTREELPQLTVSLTMTGAESLITPDIDKKAVESVTQPFTNADAAVVLTKHQDVAKAVREMTAQRLQAEMRPGGILHKSK